MTTKTFLRRTWLTMQVYAGANTEHGLQRMDNDGRIWEWVQAGKRVKAKLVPRPCSVTTSPQ